MCTHNGSRLEDGVLHDLAHATWSRRRFLRGVAMAGAAVTVGVGGTRVTAARPDALLHALAGLDSERILVIIQLSGGNDGLNTVIPIGNDRYYQLRPSIGIPPGDIIPVAPDAAIHPSLGRWESLIGDGKLEIIQNVGYASPELSHFVSTDVWLSGRDAEELESTGWSGRFLESVFPDHATTPPDNPVALQIGSSTPLLFQGAASNLGVTFPSLDVLDRLTTTGTVYDVNDVPDTSYGEEISFVRQISNASFGYAEAIKDAYDGARNQASYGSDSLARDLATVARLIRGGLGARIYHVTLGGFDTHANQVGGHSTLLSRLGNAVAAFMEDLSYDQTLDRVSGITFSEFGRRIQQNGSSGTDHGTAAPMFLFGNQLAGGVLGSTPDLVNVDASGNLVADTDFRSVYGSVLRDWFGMDQTAVDDLFGGAYPVMEAFNGSLSTDTETTGVQPAAFRIASVYPNPIGRSARVVLTLSEPGPVALSFVDMLGRTVAVPGSVGVLQAGKHDIPFGRPDDLAAGSYLLRVQHRDRSLVVPVVVN